MNLAYIIYSALDYAIKVVEKYLSITKTNGVIFRVKIPFIYNDWFLSKNSEKVVISVGRDSLPDSRPSLLKKQFETMIRVKRL